MATRPAHCVGSVPSCSMGLLIGKGGKNIQELERLSGCRLRTVPSEECQERTELHVTSSSLKADEQEKAAATCLRAACLVCEERKSIADSWRMATEERQQQQQRAAKLLEACRLQNAARKLRLACPEMSMAEASAALRESQFDEDLALDLYFQGAIVVERVGTGSMRTIESEQPKQPDEFPTLSSSSQDASVHVAEATAWCPKQVMKTRTSHGSARVMLDAEDTQAFPSLPISKVTSSAKVTSKVPTKANTKCIVKGTASRHCPSLRSNVRPITEAPRWQRHAKS